MNIRDEYDKWCNRKGKSYNGFDFEIFAAGAEPFKNEVERLERIINQSCTMSEKTFRCNHCGKTITVIDGYTAENATCGYCGEGIFIREPVKDGGKGNDT